MRGQPGRRFAEVEVVLELRRSGSLPFADRLRAETCPSASGERAQRRADVGVVGDALGDDVARARQAASTSGDLLRPPTRSAGPACPAARQRGGWRPRQVRERLEPALARDHGPGAPLGLEGQVEILELGPGQRADDRAREQLVASACPATRSTPSTVWRRASSSRSSTRALLDRCQLPPRPGRRSPPCGSAR